MNQMVMVAIVAVLTSVVSAHAAYSMQLQDNQASFSQTRLENILGFKLGNQELDDQRIELQPFRGISNTLQDQGHSILEGSKLIEQDFGELLKCVASFSQALDAVAADTIECIQGLSPQASDSEIKLCTDKLHTIQVFRLEVNNCFAQ